MNGAAILFSGHPYLHWYVHARFVLVSCNHQVTLPTNCNQQMVKRALGFCLGEVSVLGPKNSKIQHATVQKLKAERTRSACYTVMWLDFCYIKVQASISFVTKLRSSTLTKFKVAIVGRRISSECWIAASEFVRNSNTCAWAKLKIVQPIGVTSDLSCLNVVLYFAIG